jgi:hypothetical protein
MSATSMANARLKAAGKIGLPDPSGSLLAASLCVGILPAFSTQGEMAEWLKAHAWKACLGETLTWVRIPLSPPDSFKML